MKSYLVNESKAMKSISKQVEKLYKSNQILILGESENSDTGSEILRHIIELKKKDNLKILSRFFDFKNQNFYSKEFSQSLSTFEIFVFKNINYLSNEDQMSLCDFILKSDHKQFILTCFDNNHYFIDKQLKVKEIETPNFDERKEDIPQLVLNHFKNNFDSCINIDNESLEALKNHNYSYGHAEFIKILDNLFLKSSLNGNIDLKITNQVLSKEVTIIDIISNRILDKAKIIRLLTQNDFDINKTAKNCEMSFIGMSKKLKDHNIDINDLKKLIYIENQL